MTRYKHDCDKCVSLGTHNEFDLYFCGRCDGGSVIARYGSDGPDYASSPCACLETATSPALEGTGMRAVLVGFFLATKLGHYTVRPRVAQRAPHSLNVLLVDGLAALGRIKTRLNDPKTMTYDERREIAARIDGILRDETWEFTSEEREAWSKLDTSDMRRSIEAIIDKDEDFTTGERLAWCGPHDMDDRPYEKKREQVVGDLIDLLGIQTDGGMT